MILKLTNSTNEYTFEVTDLNHGEKLFYNFQIPTLDVEDGKYNMVITDDNDVVIAEEQVCIGYFNSETIQYQRAENVYINAPLEGNIQAEKNVEISEIETVIIPDDGFDAMEKVNVNTQPVYDNGYNEGENIGYNSGYTAGDADGYNRGYNEGETVQKAKLTGITITENGIYSREDGYNEITVEVPDLNGDYNEGYDAGKVDGYDSGFTAGEVEQKSKLTNITISENGTYTREDGYNTVVVNVEDTNGSYDEGYQAGVEEGTANAGEIIGETARVLNITENGTYTSEYSQWGDYTKPEQVTGVFEDGKEFFDYTQYNGYYNTGILPTKDTKLEFWIKDNSPTNYNNILYIGVDSIGTTDFYFGKMYTRQQYIASIGSSSLFFNQTDEWLHIIMSIADGLIVNGEKIGDFELSDFNIVVPIYIGQQGGGGTSPSIGMVKINDQIIIPTSDGLFNFTTNEYLSKPVSITNYIYTNNFTEPIAEGNLIRTVNVNVQPKINVSENGIKFSNSTFVELPDFFDFEGVTDMGYMFYDCQRLQTIPLIDTSKVTDMYYTFRSCNALQTIPLIDTSNVTNMERTFSDCGSLQSLPAIDTSNVENAGRMFYYCSSLQSIPALNAEKINLSSYGMFGGTLNALTDFGGLIGLKSSSNNNYSFNCCPNLNYQSCINILNGLYDFTGNGETPTSSQGQLKVHSNFLTTVGDEISIGTNKGWTITA